MISASSWRKRAWLMAGVLGLMAAAALPSMAEEQSVTMLDFEEPETMGAVFPQAGVKAERVAAHATQGGNALKVTFPAYDPKGNLWPAVTCRFDAPRDWTGCRMAKVDVYNPQAEKAEIGVLYENKHWHDYFSVEPGQTRTIEIPLADANAVNCVQFLMRLRDSQPKTPTLFFVDNFRLVSHSLSDANAVELFFRRPVSLGRLPASVPATRIVAVIRVATADADGAVGRVRMGTVVKSAPIVNGEAVIPLPVPQKDTTVTGELLDKNGKGIWSKTQEIRVLPPVPGQSGFDENGVCYVDGKPFFPIGIFNPSAEDMSLYKEMGFNCVGPYIFASATNVEAAQKNGLKLLSEGAEPNVRGRSLNEAKSLITEAMRNCPDRSVVLGYFVYDEPNPGSAPSADILKLCAEVVSADPNRAVVGINNAYYDEYAGDADVMMVDAYGFPDNSFNIILDRLSSALRAMKGRGPVWLTPQCFGWSLYCLGDTQPTEEHGRAPSFDELRSSQWLGVVLGAQGIVWYTAFAQDDATRYVWPVSWEGLKYATQEIAALQDVLVKPSVPLKSSHAKVYAAGRNLGDGVVVIVVNTADEELSDEIN